MDHTNPRPHCAPVSATDPDGLSRREVLNGALLLGAAGVLAACQTHQGQVTRLPTPVWPDADKRAATLTPIRTAASPAPSPSPSVTGLASGVIPRSAWTSAQPNFITARPKPMNGVTRITVHHSAVNSSKLVTRSDTARMLEAFRQNHVSRTDPDTGLHWVDIGYHYMIDPSGRIWEGRPVNIEGAHVSHTNQHNLGIMCMGNFDEQRPTAAALDALDSFVASQMRRYRVAVANVFTHQELRSTECPGRNLQRYMLETRRTGGRMRSLALA